MWMFWSEPVRTKFFSFIYLFFRMWIKLCQTHIHTYTDIYTQPYTHRHTFNWAILLSFRFARTKQNKINVGIQRRMWASAHEFYDDFRNGVTKYQLFRSVFTEKKNIFKIRKHTYHLASSSFVSDFNFRFFVNLSSEKYSLHEMDGTERWPSFECFIS